MMTIARRRYRAALAAFTVTATVAALAFAALVAPQQARAATSSYSLTLSASSGSYSDADTLTPTLPGCPASDLVGNFIYKGTDSWNASAINEADGNFGYGPAAPYLYFGPWNPTLHAPGAPTPWPGNLQGSYGNVQSSVSYATTADLVAALGTGVYTLAVACLDANTGGPVLDSSGTPIAASLLVQLDASSWSVSSLTLVGTNTTLTGTSSPGTMTLTAKVTAADGSVPRGSVNFFNGALGDQQSALNGSAPVPLDSNGTAQWTGPQPQYGDPFVAQFIPAAGSPDAGSHDFQTLALIQEEVAISYTVVEDPVTPSSADITATATVVGTTLQAAPTGLVGDGIDVSVDGQLLTFPYSDSVASFNSAGIATYRLTGLANGNHNIQVGLTYDYGRPWDNTVPLNYGIALTTTPANGVQVGIGPYAGATTVTLADNPHGAPQVTAVVTGQTSSGAPVSYVPAGTVDFKDGSTDLGTQVLTYSSGASSSASVPVYSLPAGANDLTATFTPADQKLFAVSSGTLEVNVPAVKTWVQPGLPVITGTAAVGKTLTVSPGTWGPGNVTRTYQWYADGSAISGATRSTLSLGKAELGKYIAVDVTGNETGDIPSDVFSPAVGPVQRKRH